MTLGTSRPVNRVSPTLYNALRRCPLQVAFGQATQGIVRRRGAAARLGDICHRVLERLALASRLCVDVTDEEVDELWNAEVRAEVAHEPRVSAPSEWPEYSRIRWRLPRVARTVGAIAASAGPKADILPELEMVSRDGIIHGRADLVIRGSLRRICIDYKTGHVVDPITAELRDDYATQLHLYSFLESESSGVWPDSAAAVPFGGPPIEVDVDPMEGNRLADDA